MPAGLGAYELLLALPNGLREEELHLECAHQHDRQPAPPADEARIEAIWAERLAANPALFNGTKFRFAAADPGAGQGAWLRLGITDYRSFLGTNCAPSWERLLAGSEAQLASPLGNAGVVQTCDGRVVLLRRSGNVGECPHSVVMPGGHPEPGELGIEAVEAWGEQAGPEWLDRVRHELWDAMVREVVEETGVPRESLGPPICIGFTRRVLNHRPDIVFLIQCDLPSARVLELYAGAVDRDESTELFTLETEEFVSQVLEEDSLPMPGCHRGGVELLRQYLAHQAAQARE